MAVTPPVTLAELKVHLHVPSAADPVRDPVLTRQLAAATGLVEDRVGAMVVRDVSERVYPTGRVLVLSESPIVSITSVTDADGTAVDLGTLDQDTEALILSLAAPGALSGVHTVDYQVGRPEVPDELKEATLIVAEQLSQSARGPVPQSKFTENSATPPRGFAWPHRAKQLCEPHARHWVVV